MLDRQPDQIRDFLLATSVLDTLDADSCALVTERSDADGQLTRLKERNLFLIELGRGVYRYHQLFADLLRYRLRAEDPDREHALHRRAAAFFIKTGDPENAIGHFLAAGQHAEAFEVLRGNLIGAFSQADGRLPGRLVAKFEGYSATIEPARMPDLALALAAVGRTGEAGAWIARAGRHAAVLSDAGRARLAVAQAMVAQHYGEALGIERAFCPIKDPRLCPIKSSVISFRPCWHEAGSGSAI